MKTINIFKSAILLSLLFALSNCTESAKKEAEKKNENVMSNKSDDAQLIVDLVSSQYYEIELAKYIQARSSDAEVKKIAGTLITDHTQMLEGLNQLASEKSIAVPTNDTTDVKTTTNVWIKSEISVQERDWLNKMIDGHKSTYNKMQKEVDDAEADPDIKKLLQGYLPTVQSHLDMLNACLDHRNKKK